MVTLIVSTAALVGSGVYLVKSGLYVYNTVADFMADTYEERRLSTVK